MFRCLLLLCFATLTNGKSLPVGNSTITIATMAITSTLSTRTSSDETRTMKIVNTPVVTTKIYAYEDENTTATMEKSQNYEFESNFTRNNDFVFVSHRSNASDIFVFINNTFIDAKSNPCELLIEEHSIKPNIAVSTIISVNINGSLTRHLTTQLGDRLFDIVDLLGTLREMHN